MGIYDYIKTLPMPLSKEEQQTLLNIFYTTRQDDVRELLILHNLRLVASCVMEFRGICKDLEDLMTIGTIELINVIDNKFDISKGISLSTYATKSIRLRLLSEINIKTRSMDAIHQPHQSTIINKDDEEVDIFKTIADDTNFVEDIAFKDFINRFVSALSEYERYLLEHRLDFFGKEIETYKAIAEKFNKAEKKVAEDMCSLKEKLKDYLKTGKLKNDENSPEMQAIIEYIKTTNNENYKFVLEHTYGLNGNKIMTPKEINEELGCNGRYCHDVLYKLKNAGIIANTEGTIDINEVLNYISQCDNKKDIQILELYYGLNGNETHSRSEIAEILGMNYKPLSDRLIKLFKHIKNNADRKANKLGIQRKEEFIEEFYSVLNNQREQLIFAHTYGIDGYDVLGVDEITKIVGMSRASVYRIKNKLEAQFKTFVEEKDCQM